MSVKGSTTISKIFIVVKAKHQIDDNSSTHWVDDLILDFFMFHMIINNDQDTPGIFVYCLLTCFKVCLEILS